MISIKDRVEKGYRKKLLRWGAWFAIFNTILLLIVFGRYWHYMDLMEGPLSYGYMTLSMIGHCSSIAFLFYIGIMVPLILIWPNRWIVWSVAIFIGAAGISLLLLDTVVYGLYRFHLSGLIFEMFIDAGDEIFAFSWFTWVVAIGSVLSVLVFQIIGTWFVWEKILPVRRIRTAVSLCVIIFVSLIGSHTIHAWADVTYYRPITSTTRHIPLYYPLTAKRFLQRHGLVDLAKNREQRELKVNFKKKGTIAYPKNPLQFKKVNNPLNVLFIVVDSWRFDMLTDGVTPNVFKFISTAPITRYHNHMSGGNGTRIGIFTLFYGLFGTYWDAMAEEQIGPVLIKTLISRRYQVGIFSGSRLTTPPFNRTVFNDVENLRSLPTGDQAWERDLNALEEWIAWLDQRDANRPFFGFFFFDSIHGYSFPPDYPILFNPIWKRVDHLALNENFKRELFLNRYKVCAHYVDSLIGRALADLKRRGLMERTLILFTGDHSEEFNDNNRNFWGHGGNYTRYQIQVPLAIYWPGRQKADFMHVTTHMDVAPTLMMDILGCTNPVTDYSNGYHLNETNRRDWFLAGGYFNHAIVEKDRITKSYPTGSYEIFDKTNKPLGDAIIHAGVVKESMEEASRFYKR